MSTSQVAPRLQPDIAPELEGGSSAAMHLVSTVQALSLARDLNTVIDVVRKAARKLCGADGATFILRDGDKCYYADEDAVAPLWKGQRFPMSACISGWVMAHRQATMIKDIYADERIPFDVYRPTFVKSLAIVPIRSEDPIGAIGIYWSERHAASDFEIELLQALVDSTAVAMENVQLYAELERRVKERTRQLEDTNRELETFSYSVSHDLQAPLRHIAAYTELLISDHGASLDEEGSRCLGRIHDSAGHMSGLIQDLLRLSRLVGVGIVPRPVDLSEMARLIGEGLREENPGRQVEFRVQEHVSGQGDEALLRIVLQNLLANAWKFTSKRESALIEFGSTTQNDGTLAYFVKDNGAGFDMRYADRLFGPFQRLHGAKEFSGTGIGLATMKRIIHRHDGTVWADAALGQGATFYFTLGSPSKTPSFADLRDGRG